MGEDEIFDVLRTLCARVLSVDPAEVTPDADLRQVLEADSLDIAELAMAVEKRFGPVFDGDAARAAQARTVGDVVALVGRRIGRDAAVRPA